MEERASLGLVGTLCRVQEVALEMVVYPNMKKGEAQSTCHMKRIKLQETFSYSTFMIKDIEVFILI